MIILLYLGHVLSLAGGVYSLIETVVLLPSFLLNLYYVGLMCYALDILLFGADFTLLIATIITAINSIMVSFPLIPILSVIGGSI